VYHGFLSQNAHEFVSKRGDEMANAFIDTYHREDIMLSMPFRLKYPHLSLGYESYDMNNDDENNGGIIHRSISPCYDDVNELHSYTLDTSIDQEAISYLVGGNRVVSVSGLTKSDYDRCIMACCHQCKTISKVHLF